jgi:hypothetical protein
MHRYGIVLVTAALAAIGTGDSRLAAATGPRLTAITSTAGVRPAVLIESSEPVAYAAERPDPFTVVVDLRNVSPAGYANGFVADPASPVRGIAVEAARADDGTPVARVKVSLAEPVSHKVHSQRNLIVIELDRDTALSAGATSVIAPVAHTESVAGRRELCRPSAPSRPATARHRASGNRRLSVKRVEPARAASISISGVSPQVAAVTRSADPIDKVRVALSSREPIVTRVVIDLARDVSITWSLPAPTAATCALASRRRRPSRKPATVRRTRHLSRPPPRRWLQRTSPSPRTWRTHRTRRT